MLQGDRFLLQELQTLNFSLNIYTFISFFLGIFKGFGFVGVFVVVGGGVCLVFKVTVTF